MAADQRKKNRVKHLKVDEVSVVDNPANAGARFVLMKRHAEDIRKDDDDVEELDDDELELDDSSDDEDDDVIEDELDDEDGEDVDEDELDALDEELDSIEAELAEMDDEEEDEEANEPVAVGKAHTLFSATRARTSVWPMVDALRESVNSIINDEDADEGMKKSAIAKTTRQFAAEMQKLVGDAGSEGEEVEKVEKSTNTRGSNMARQPISKLEIQYEKLHKRNVTLEKRVEEMEYDRAVEKATIEARSILGKNAAQEDLDAAVEMIVAGDEKGIKLLKRMAERTVRLAKDARIFEEIGSSRGNGGGNSGAQAAETMAEELMKNDPKLSRPEAIAKAYETLGDEAYLEGDED